MAEGISVKAYDSAPPDPRVPEADTGQAHSLDSYSVSPAGRTAHDEQHTSAGLSDFHSSSADSAPADMNENRTTKTEAAKNTKPSKKSSRTKGDVRAQNIRTKTNQNKADSAKKPAIVDIELKLPPRLMQEALRDGQRNQNAIAAKVQMCNIESQVRVKKCSELKHTLDKIYNIFHAVAKKKPPDEKSLVSVYKTLSAKYKEYLCGYRILGWHNDPEHVLTEQEKIWHFTMLNIIIERGALANDTDEIKAQFVSKTSRELFQVTDNEASVDLMELDGSATETQLEEFRQNLRNLFEPGAFLCECSIRIKILESEVDEEIRKKILKEKFKSIEDLFLIQHSFRRLFACWVLIFEDVLKNANFKSKSVYADVLRVSRESCVTWLNMFYQYINDDIISRGSDILNIKSVVSETTFCLTNCLQLCLICNVRPCFIKVLDLLDKRVSCVSDADRGKGFVTGIIIESESQIYLRTIESLNQFLIAVQNELNGMISFSGNENYYLLTTDVINLIKISFNSHYLNQLPYFCVRILQFKLNPFLFSGLQNILGQLDKNIRQILTTVYQILETHLSESKKLSEKQFCELQLRQLELLSQESECLNPAKKRSALKSSADQKITTANMTKEVTDASNSDNEDCSADETEEPLAFPMIYAPVPDLTEKVNKTGRVKSRPFIEKCRLICAKDTATKAEVLSFFTMWKEMVSEIDRFFDKSDYYYQGREALSLMIPLIRNQPGIKVIRIEMQLRLIGCNFFIGQQQLKFLYAHKTFIDRYENSLKIALKEQKHLDKNNDLAKEGRLYKIIVRSTPDIAGKFTQAFTEISQILSQLRQDTTDILMRPISFSHLSTKRELEEGMALLKNLSSTTKCIYKLKGELIKSRREFFTRQSLTDYLPKSSDPLLKEEVEIAVSEMDSLHEKTQQWTSLFDTYQQVISEVTA